MMGEPRFKWIGLRRKALHGNTALKIAVIWVSTPLSGYVGNRIG